MTKGYHGSMRMSDGTRKELTEEEAKALWDAAKLAQKKRAELMPTARDALSHLTDAKDRLRELGWRDARYCPRDESLFAVCEIGSTGMWRAFFHDELIHYGDCVSNPRGMFFKPLADLTDQEREWMEKCDRRVADEISRMGDSL